MHTWLVVNHHAFRVVTHQTISLRWITTKSTFNILYSNQNYGSINQLHLHSHITLAIWLISLDMSLNQLLSFYWLVHLHLLSPLVYTKSECYKIVNIDWYWFKLLSNMKQTLVYQLKLLLYRKHIYCLQTKSYYHMCFSVLLICACCAEF